MPKIDDKTIEQDLRAIVSSVTEIELAKVTLDASFVEELGMDSMMALEILAAIEKKYKIQIPEEKLPHLKNLRESVKVTKEYL